MNRILNAVRYALFGVKSDLMRQTEESYEEINKNHQIALDIYVNLRDELEEAKQEYETAATDLRFKKAFYKRGPVTDTFQMSRIEYEEIDEGFQPYFIESWNEETQVLGFRLFDGRWGSADLTGFKEHSFSKGSVGKFYKIKFCMEKS